jgi:TnpA family transposase
MTADVHTPPSGSRILYPELPTPLSPADLHRWFGPSYDDRRWVPTVARTPAAQRAVLVQLGVFRALGRFLAPDAIPSAVIEYVAERVGIHVPAPGAYSPSTVYRHQRAVLSYLGVAAWNPQARRLTEATMAKMAEARTDPADLINAAVDALVRHRFELPTLTLLRRLASLAHHTVNEQQWSEVCAKLTDPQRAVLEAMLVVAPDARESPFSRVCSGAGRATRKNLKALIERYQWLCNLPDPTRPLASIAEAKVLQWANEARRLKAPELRAYVAQRRLTLLLAMIREARGRILDDMTQMLLKLARNIEWRSEEHLNDWHAGRHRQTDSLIMALRDVLQVLGTDEEPIKKVACLDAIILTHGGREALELACAEHLRHERRNWRPFARQAFAPLRAPLMQLAYTLPLTATPEAMDLLRLVASATFDSPPYSDYVRISDIKNPLPSEWRALVMDRVDDALAYNRRQVEVAAILELANAIKAGEIFVEGSLSYDQFWHRLPAEAVAPEAMAEYGSAREWDPGAEGFVRTLKEALGRDASQLDTEIHQYGTVKRDKQDRLVVARTRALPIPASAVELEKELLQRMPERPVLAALINTEHWFRWGRHFGPPSRLAPQIKDASGRYVLTTFAYGCGLGPTQAARHLNGAVTADQLGFVDRRHIDIADLRAASADIINQYALYELPRYWGSGEASAADGTHFQTYEANLLAEHHIRYGKTGGIAYRHIADNYIALFSSFIACGTYEATYILDAFHRNLSTVRPRRIHADTHGQSAAVFGLAYLLGIELMPRIRRWRKLKLYRPYEECRYKCISSLFHRAVNWSLIRAHYPQFMKLALGIQSGRLAPSAVLARINSYSTRNLFAQALQELGRAVRTKFLLRWIWDEEMRRTVHKCTTKIERHHRFAKYLSFGGEVLLRTNNPADLEKAIVYNELVANCVALQNVVDQSQALRSMIAQGVPVNLADCAYLSPYPTAHLKRFGDYPKDLSPEAEPPTKSLLN